MDLGQVVAAHRVILCLGSGGVGKTTCSAALALAAALDGKRVLCLTIDPAERLANSLGLPRFDHQLHRVSAAHFARTGLQCRGELWASTLNPRATFDALVQNHAPNPALAERLLQSRYYQHIASSLAGTREYMALETLHTLEQDPRWDLLVLDTPPTTHAIDFLDAPDRLVDAIDSPASHWLMQIFQGQTPGKMAVVGRSIGLIVRALARFTGTQFLDQVAMLITDLNSLFGGFRSRALAVQQTLRAPSTGFLVVTSPQAPARRQVGVIAAALRERGMRLQGLILNGMRQDPGIQDVSAASHSLEQVETQLPQAFFATLRQLTRAQQQAANSDADALASLRQAQPQLPIATAAAMDREVYDLAALAALARDLSHPHTHDTAKEQP